ncbi:TonB-dependent receptor plug domain-containing protein [Steroidobacter cummioxidans]|uniref:TonB-dependent receptor plug domain-containing protein n=1 Tax=Steroidobacter cummioxidans TaxID=1803913 RepID=UPI0013798409|nr:TonB-dependent receptor [Steroidobacter cummioxidans]
MLAWCAGSVVPLAALAQDVPAGASQPNSLQEVVVTGSRISRENFEAPTPLTVIGTEQINQAAPENLADFVNDMPAMVGSATPQTSNLSFSNGQAGINALNLRGLGTVRTLVLLDGKRSVPSAITGIVDINDLPQSLVQRVEVVTGGASAAYGSDAMTGVVNFVLDKDFTGLKSEVSGGRTDYGDDDNWKVTLTGGLPFADGRGHLLLNGEYTHRDGIYGVPRSWNNDGRYIMNNPAYTPTSGLPERLVVSGASLTTATLGGIITNTALRGTTFGEGGTPRQFQYGSLVRDPWMQGGEWASNQFNQYNTLDQEVDRTGLFARVNFSLTDNFGVFAQASRNESETRSWQLKQFNLANLVIRAGNPFIPASVAAQMADQGITQFTLGTMNNDIPTISFTGQREVTRLMAGFEGGFDLFGSTWNWDAYYQLGTTNSSETGYNISSKARYAAALDTVVNPANGQPICRSTLTTPNDGCLPYNPMGLNVNSPETIAWLIGSPHRDQRFTQEVVAATVRGEPFNSWAGPVSIAIGIERRDEKVRGESDSTSMVNGWFAGNYLPTFGSYHVAEAFLETVVPLAKDVPFAQSFDLNAAVRRTDYSTSGLVTTWKAGAVWQPIDDLRFRVTRSRDIRAPNLNELFAAGTANTNSVIDPFNNNQNAPYQGLAVGNPLLQPEKADTLGIGVVLQPRFLEGFTASVDYYDVKISDAIGNVAAQNIVDNCFAGIQAFCSAITRGIGAGGVSQITQIRLSPFNLVELKARGIDYEMSYAFGIDRWFSNLTGNLRFSLLATNYLENYQDNGVNPPADSVGSNSGLNGLGTSGPPDWVYRATLAYSGERISTSLTARGFSSGTYSNTYIECTSGCPVSTADNPTINDNSLAGAFYLDASVSYKMRWAASDVETFLSVVNLANKDPAMVPQGPAGISYAQAPVNASLYDILGRVYRVGVRMKM